MNTSYTLEVIAGQRLDQAARIARVASERPQLKVRARWHFPKVTWPTRHTTLTPRPA
jgi:hypothetical protein